jgi:hypothetical protein
MVGTVGKVFVTKVDSDSVEKDNSFSKAYAFYVALSETPAPIWIELFMTRYETTFTNLKRQMTIQGNRVRVVTAPGEEEDHVRFLRHVVDETNKDVDEYNKKLARQAAGQGALKKMEDAEAQQIKERLRRISII